MIDGFEGTTLEGDTFRWKHDQDGKFYICEFIGNRYPGCLRTK